MAEHEPEQPASPFRADCLNGQVAFVTGGATGIGFGICEVLAAHGARLALFGRRLEKLKEAKVSLTSRWPTCEALCVQGDVRDASKCDEAVQKVCAQWGRLDVLVNCAAGNFMSAAEDLGAKGFRTVIDIDLQGTFNMSIAAVPALSLTKNPRTIAPTAGPPVIVNISATLQYKGTPFQAHACAAKAGIDALTRTLGVEFASEHGVRVVGVAPGPIAGTEGGPTGRVFGAAIAGQDVRDMIPQGRWGETHDIGLSVLYLATSAGGYVNGETVVVDGGQWSDGARGFRQGREFLRQLSQSRKAKL